MCTIPLLVPLEYKISAVPGTYRLLESSLSPNTNMRGSRFRLQLSDLTEGRPVAPGTGSPGYEAAEAIELVHVAPPYIHTVHGISIGELEQPAGLPARTPLALQLT